MEEKDIEFWADQSKL